MTKEELLQIRIDDVPEETFAELKKIVDDLPKPLNGLGEFENLICRIGGAQHTTSPDISKKALIIMCADNGVIEEGVTEEGGYVTGFVANKIANGETAISLMAESAGVKVIPVDIGINGEISNEKLLNKKISNGTRNFLKEPAMTEEQLMQAIETGIDLVKELKEEGYGIICTGDMSIGSTTTASAVICGIIEGDPYAITEKGIDGTSDYNLDKKKDVILEALHMYGYDSFGASYGDTFDLNDYEDGHNDSRRVFDILMNIGGFDIAGMVGVFIGSAMFHVPVVVDGITSAAAALAADNIIPGCRNYCISSHNGTYTATDIVFQELEMRPVINANLIMGEGIGAVMLMPIMDMVVKVFNELGNFDGIELTDIEE